MLFARLLRSLREPRVIDSPPFQPTLEILEDRTHCAVGVLAQPMLVTVTHQINNTTSVSQPSTSAVAVNASSTVQGSVSQATTTNASSSSAALVNGVIDRLFAAAAGNTSPGVGSPGPAMESRQEPGAQSPGRNETPAKPLLPLPIAHSGPSGSEEVALPPSIVPNRPDTTSNTTGRIVAALAQELTDALLNREREALPPPDAEQERDRRVLLDLQELVPGGRIIARLMPRTDSGPAAIALPLVEETTVIPARQALPIEDGPFMHMIGLNLQGRSAAPQTVVEAPPLEHQPATTTAKQEEDAPHSLDPAWYVLGLLLAAWFLFA